MCQSPNYFGSLSGCYCKLTHKVFFWTKLISQRKDGKIAGINLISVVILKAFVDWLHHIYTVLFLDQGRVKKNTPLSQYTKEEMANFQSIILFSIISKLYTRDHYRKFIDWVMQNIKSWQKTDVQWFIFSIHFNITYLRHPLGFPYWFKGSFELVSVTRLWDKVAAVSTKLHVNNVTQLCYADSGYLSL